MRPLVIAHRGASRAFPENTVEAFVAARDMGADMVELDVRPTADGKLAVHHDADLPDGRAINNLSLADTGLLDLAGALAACDGMSVNIELKHEAGEGEDELAWVDTVAETVVSAGWAGRVLLSSFAPGVLRRLAQRHGDLRRALLVVAVPDQRRLLDALVADGTTALHPWDGCTTASLVDAAHEAGLAVNVWTVDDAGRMRELAAWGVDGICTNQPDLARAVLDH